MLKNMYKQIWQYLDIPDVSMGLQYIHRIYKWKLQYTLFSVYKYRQKYKLYECGN